MFLLKVLSGLCLGVAVGVVWRYFFEIKRCGMEA